MDIKQISFSGEKTKYLTPTWNDMNQLAFLIAKEMRAQGKEIDRIVTLAKGGWPMTRSLVDFLQVGKVASIGVNFYKGINERMKTPEIYQNLPVPIKGERVLLFDDVADTGASLKFVKKYLKDMGVKEVITATLFYKPHSAIEPDFYGHKTKAWIIFPYDLIEAVDLLGGKWQEKGLQKAEIKKRLKQLGAKEEWLREYFA